MEDKVQRSRVAVQADCPVAGWGGGVHKPRVHQEERRPRKHHGGTLSKVATPQRLLDPPARCNTAHRPASCHQCPAHATGQCQVRLGAANLQEASRTMGCRVLPQQLSPPPCWVQQGSGWCCVVSAELSPSLGCARPPDRGWAAQLAATRGLLQRALSHHAANTLASLPQAVSECQSRRSRTGAPSGQGRGSPPAPLPMLMQACACYSP
jgi:hypothetical protein